MNDANTTRRSFQVYFLSSEIRKKFRRKVNLMQAAGNLVDFTKEKDFYTITSVEGHEKTYEDLLEMCKKMAGKKVSTENVVLPLCFVRELA